MARSKYMCLKLGNIPESLVQHYNMEDKATRDGYVYVEIQRGIYGLPQAGPIAQQLIETWLNKKGYHHIEITPDVGNKNGARYSSHSVLIILV